MRKSLSRQHAKDIMEYTQQIHAKNKEIEALKKRIAKVREHVWGGGGEEERKASAKDRVAKVSEYVCVGGRERVVPRIRVAKVRECVCGGGRERVVGYVTC